MAGGWNSGSDREAMLRRVAIVLSSLPTPTAAKLLGFVDSESKLAVRRTMSALTDVDPLERQRAIQAFKVMLQRQPAPAVQMAPNGDSLQIQAASQAGNATSGSRVLSGAGASTAAPSATSRANEARALDAGARETLSWESRSAVTQADAVETPGERSPLSFLSTVDDRALAKLLTAEHPQTIAFVLASIAPAQAARVLPQLGSKLQVEIMSRIGRLGEIPETAVAEVAEHFRGRLKEHTSSDRHALGRQALDAIIAAMPRGGASAGARTGENLERSATAASTRTSASDHGTRSEYPAAHEGAADIPALDLTHRLRLAEQTWPEQIASTQSNRSSESVGDPNAAPSHQGTSSTATSTRELRDRNPSDQSSPRHDVAVPDRQTAAPPNVRPNELPSGAFASTDGIHQHLVDLSPKELCQALAKVETRDAMLALCGLPVHVADAALAVLPRAQAKAVRGKMNSLGSLHLREIDLAKERVAEASLGLVNVASPLAA